MSATAFIRVSVLLDHHASDLPKMGLPLNNSIKGECTGFTSQYRTWLKFILDYASFQTTGLTFIVKGFSAMSFSSKLYQNWRFYEILEDLLLAESNYPPFTFSAIDPVQEMDIRGKKRHSILKVKLVNGTWEEEVLRKKYVKGNTAEETSFSQDKQWNMLISFYGQRYFLH